MSKVTVMPKKPSKQPMPKLKPGDPNLYVTIRVTPTDKEHLKAEAEKLGLNVSSWLRQLSGLDASTHLRPVASRRSVPEKKVSKESVEPFTSPVLKKVSIAESKLDDIEVESDQAGLSVPEYLEKMIPIYLGAYQLSTADLELRLNLEQGALLDTYADYAADRRQVLARAKFSRVLAELDPIGLPWEFDGIDTWTCVFKPKKLTKADLADRLG
jgi:hypothetical protein